MVRRIRIRIEEDGRKEERNEVSKKEWQGYKRGGLGGWKKLRRKLSVEGKASIYLPQCRLQNFEFKEILPL